MYRKRSNEVRVVVVWTLPPRQRRGTKSEENVQQAEENGVTLMDEDMTRSQKSGKSQASQHQLAGDEATLHTGSG